VWKLPTSTQLRATWYTDSLDMIVLPSTGASRYHNCCIDGGTSPEYFGYTLVYWVWSAPGLLQSSTLLAVALSRLATLFATICNLSVHIYNNSPLSSSTLCPVFVWFPHSRFTFCSGVRLLCKSMMLVRPTSRRTLHCYFQFTSCYDQAPPLPLPLSLLMSYIYGRDFLLGILLLEPCISLIYAWKTNKYTNYSFSLLIMYGSSTSLDTSRPSTIFYRLLLNWASLRRHKELSLKMAM
jgi:hypothetical protein